MISKIGKRNPQLLGKKRERLVRGIRIEVLLAWGNTETEGRKKVRKRSFIWENT